MSLESLRKKVLFQNSIDVWMAVASDKGIEWNNTDGYKKFIEYLLENNLNLNTFTLCVHEAGATDHEKTGFVEELAQMKGNDPHAATYTIRLTDPAMCIIKNFSP